MDCNEVKELLSAYYDNELSFEKRTAVEEHLAGCDECAQELASFRDLSAIAKRLTSPEPPAHIWNGLQVHLDIEAARTAEPRYSRKWLGWTAKPVARFVLATSAVVLVVVGWLGYAAWDDHSAHHQMVAVFGQYLDQFRLDPHAAQEILLAHYDGRAVDADQAIHTVGYRPLVAEGMPPGYSVASTHVMKMPCCTCVECFCQRDDGTTIAIFEHDDEQPDWFGNRAKKEAVFTGTRCSLVELDGRLAATWRCGTRHISVIGARDAPEVSQLVAWFDDRRKRLPN